MRDQAETNLCARADDLVAYLYGEASEPEALAFESHMRGCESCAAEAEAFGHVRASIGEWRSQTIGSIASPVAVTALAPDRDSAGTRARKPSALAALREFFALSPLWMRGATAFAGLAVCALVVFAAVRLIEEPRVVVMEKVVEKGPSQAEVNALVDKKVREELAFRDQRESAPVEQQQQLVTNVSAQRDSLSARTRRSRPAPILTQASASRRAPVQVSTQESEQIARDLQLIPTRDEEDLPRLIDLMDEAN
ncbi:MAG TPA: zf-HC2 domain-containing protein [Pyrinomonadaceae bacterium]